MEDKEHETKILAIKQIYDVIHKAPCMQAHEGEAWAVSEHLYNLSYCQLPKEKPRLLGDEEIHEKMDELHPDYSNIYRLAFHDGMHIGSKAQRELDIKHYEGTE